MSPTLTQSLLPYFESAQNIEYNLIFMQIFGISLTNFAYCAIHAHDIHMPSYCHSLIIARNSFSYHIPICLSFLNFFEPLSVPCLLRMLLL